MVSGKRLLQLEGGIKGAVSGMGGVDAVVDAVEDIIDGRYWLAKVV